MKSFFLSRQLREKLMLLVFVILGASIWASSAWDRTARVLSEVQGTTADLAEQKLWLDRREEIAAAAAAAIENFDSSRTFNEVRLSAELSAIANQTGVAANATSSPLGTQRTAQFSMHSLQFTLNRVDYTQLFRFYNALAQRAPYISIEQFSVSADRSGQMLNASLRVSSVDITR